MRAAKNRLLSAFAFCVVICFFTIAVGKLNFQEIPNMHHADLLIVLRIPCDCKLFSAIAFTFNLFVFKFAKEHWMVIK